MFYRSPASQVCWKCGYSRDGLSPDARCPECGSTPADQPKKSHIMLLITVLFFLPILLIAAYVAMLLVALREG